MTRPGDHILHARIPQGGNHAATCGAACTCAGHADQAAGTPT